MKDKNIHKEQYIWEHCSLCNAGRGETHDKKCPNYGKPALTKHLIKTKKIKMKEITPLINIADLKDPNDDQGRSYREVNAAKVHIFKVGDLVELECGVRLFVMKKTRDCDQTPLYSLGIEATNSWQWSHGYGEEGLTKVD